MRTPSRPWRGRRPRGWPIRGSRRSTAPGIYPHGRSTPALQSRRLSSRFGDDFSGLNLRGIKMDRAVLSGADFTGAHLQSANLIGAIAERACFARADLSRARLSGANLVSASLEDACLAKAEMEVALAANTVMRGACLREADMS